MSTFDFLCVLNFVRREDAKHLASGYSLKWRGHVQRMVRGNLAPGACQAIVLAGRAECTTAMLELQPVLCDAARGLEAAVLTICA